MPNSAAFLSFDPAPGPATTKSVLAETDPTALAPNCSACALASSLLMVSSLPVKTMVLPVSSDSRMLETQGCGRTSLSMSLQVARLCGSWKTSNSASTTVGPKPTTATHSARAGSSSCAAGATTACSSTD